jgi:hypothetical protein
LKRSPIKAGLWESPLVGEVTHEVPPSRRLLFLLPHALLAKGHWPRKKDGPHGESPRGTSAILSGRMSNLPGRTAKEPVGRDGGKEGFLLHLMTGQRSEFRCGSGEMCVNHTSGVAAGRCSRIKHNMAT